MPANTPKLGLPYPTSDESVDVPRDMKALADKLDAGAIAPVGCIMMWPTPTPPQGWAICDGGTVPAANNPQLAALLGQTGGNVTLPDMRGRVPVGAGTAQGDTTAVAKTLSVPGGSEKVKLLAAQSGMPLHAHTQGSLNADNAHAWQPGWNVPLGDSSWGGYLVAAGGNYLMAASDGTNVSWASGFHQHKVNGTTDQSQSDAAQTHENMPPYLVINYIIRVG
jgi:microcystin-dependent protein